MINLMVVTFCWIGLLHTSINLLLVDAFQCHPIIQCRFCATDWCNSRMGSWKASSPLPTRIRLLELSAAASSSRSRDDDDSLIQEFGSHRQDPAWQERSKRWILLIDDEESIRTAVGQLLSDRGYQVTACADGRTGLDACSSRRSSSSNTNNNVVPDVIVSDVRMPEMDGIELLQMIRSNTDLMDIPVILLTAKGKPQDRIDGYNAGADAYIPKPFDPEELVAIIDSLILRQETLLLVPGSGRKNNNIDIQDLKRDLDEIKYLLIEKGGGGVGNGWVEATNVFLTPYEREVLELLCEGLMNKEIAERAFLSSRRVEQLLTGMYRKTQTKNRTELVRWAISTGNVQI